MAGTKKPAALHRTECYLQKSRCSVLLTLHKRRERALQEAVGGGQLPAIMPGVGTAACHRKSLFLMRVGQWQENIPAPTIRALSLPPSFPTATRVRRLALLSAMSRVTGARRQSLRFPFAFLPESRSSFNPVPSRGAGRRRCGEIK